MSTLTSQQKRLTRHRRIRKKISGISSCPRLAVYRSNAFIYAQIIDDSTMKTLASASDVAVKKGTKTERAQSVGADIAEKAQKLGITSVVFDRGGFIYTGRVAALADAAREWWLIF